MRFKSLLMATALLAVLGGLVYWSEQDKKKKEAEPAKDAPPQIASVSQEDVQRVSMRRIGGEPTEVERTSDGWKFVKPANLNLDPDAVTPVLSTLSSITSDRVVDEAATDLMPFGLEPPSFEVTVAKKDGKEVKLLFGDETPTKGSYYAKLAGDPRVFTVASYVRNGLDKTPADLRDRRLVAFDPQKITKIKIQTGGQTFELGKNSGGDWALVSPTAMRADSTQVDSLMRSLREAKLDPATNESAAKANVKSFNSGKPAAVITVTDQTGDHKLEVRQYIDLYFAKGSDVEGIHSVDSTSGQALARDMSAYENRRVFEFGWDDPTRVQVDKTLYEKKDENWVTGGKELDPESIQSLIDRLRELTANRVARQANASGEKVMELTVTSKEGSRVEKVNIFKNGSTYLATREGDPLGYDLDASVFDSIKAATAVKAKQKAENDKK